MEGGFSTGTSTEPHLPHLMNEKSADLIERHSKQLLLSSRGEEERKREHTLEWSRCCRKVQSNDDL